MNGERRSKLVGPVAALRTFRTDDGKLDLEKQSFHLNWVIEQGITTGNGCIMVAAGGSEGYFMSDDEWKAEVKMAAEVARGRVPLAAGVFELSATEAVKKAEFAASVGCDFAQVAPPHYMVPTDDEVYHHFKLINDSVDIGIMAYNTPWAMPQPGYDFTWQLLERFIDLENVEGVKWSSHNQATYVGTLRRFADKFSFINNQGNVLSLPIKLGCKGFINSDGLVAPRLVLHLWEMWKSKRYDDYDDLTLKLYVDPFLNLSQPEDIKWRGMGEGPHARAGMEVMGLKMGPSFPAQQDPPESYRRARKEGYDKSGMAEWVDWREEIYEQARARKRAPAASRR